MSSNATQAQEPRSYGGHGSRVWQNQSIFSGGLAGGLLLLTIFAAALLGSALFGRAGQASTEFSAERVSVETWARGDPRQGDLSAVEDAGKAMGVAERGGVFVVQPPEQLPPEPGALGYLRLLEHLPAKPPALGAVSSPFGTRIAPEGRRRYVAQYHQGEYPNGGYQSGRRLGEGDLGEEFHSGIDIAVPPGTPVRAPGPGVVIATGRSPRLGTYVRLLHEEVQLETVLAHLTRIQDGLRRGHAVRRGEVVGFSGNSGRSTGPHLHFEIRLRPDRTPVDPTEVYDLYFTCLDQLSRFPIGAVHARLEPYRIWAPAGEGRGNSEEGGARGGIPGG